MPNYLNQIRYQDSPNLDAFSRLRISSPVTLFDNTQAYGDSSLVFENAFVGTGAVSNVYNSSSVLMTTGGTGSTASAIRSTKTSFHYFPGKSQFVTMTFTFTGQTNSTQRAGYFDGQNGVYFEWVNNTTANVVLRTYTSGSVAESRIAQSSWNIDKMDGTGPSGITLNMANSQILVIDLQWLGEGRVRIGFDTNGVLYYVHQFLAANVISLPYMTTGSQPIRFECFNTGSAGGTATILQTCATVVYEGQNEPLRGFQFSADNGTTAVSVSSTLVPILSIRASTTGPNSQANKGQILIQSYTLNPVGSYPMLYQLYLNPTLGGAGLSFAKVNSTYSLAEVDVGATTISGGVLVDSGYAIAGPAGTIHPPTVNSLASELALVYSSLLNYQDILTIAGKFFTTGTSCTASVDWLELT